MLSRIMPGPFGSQARRAFASWAMLSALGVVMMVTHANMMAAFVFTMVGVVGTILSWPEVKRARRARRHDEG